MSLESFNLTDFSYTESAEKEEHREMQNIKKEQKNCSV